MAGDGWLPRSILVSVAASLTLSPKRKQPDRREPIGLFPSGLAILFRQRAHRFACKCVSSSASWESFSLRAPASACADILRSRPPLPGAQREFHRRLQIAELAAAVEARAVILVREHLLVGEQRLDRVRQLQFAAGARLASREMFEDARLQHIAAHHAEIRRRDCRLRLLDDAATS